MKYVLRCTDPAGQKYGSQWGQCSWVSILMFNLMLIGMSSVVRSTIKEYFGKGNSIADEKMSGRQFLRMYYAFKTYDQDEADQSGWSKKENKETYDSLWKCRSLWNMTMVQFQTMRNPPRCLSLDESMSKYTVRFPT